MGSRYVDADKLLARLREMDSSVAHTLYEDAIDAVKRLIEEGSPTDQPQGQQGSVPSGGPAAPDWRRTVGATTPQPLEPPPGYWVGEDLGQSHATSAWVVPWGIVVDGLECLVGHCGSTSDAMAACWSHRDAVLASHRDRMTCAADCGHQQHGRAYWCHRCGTLRFPEGCPQWAADLPHDVQLGPGLLERLSEPTRLPEGARIDGDAVVLHSGTRVWLDGRGGGYIEHAAEPGVDSVRRQEIDALLYLLSRTEDTHG